MAKYFTCEIHKKRFATLTDIKRHDLEYHSNEDHDDDTSLKEDSKIARITIKQEEETIIPNSTAEPSSTIFICHICEEPCFTSEVLLEHLSTHSQRQPTEVDVKHQDLLQVKIEVPLPPPESEPEADATSDEEKTDSDPDFVLDQTGSKRKKKSALTKPATKSRLKPKQQTYSKSKRRNDLQRGMNNPLHSTFNPLLPTGLISCYFCFHKPVVGQLLTFENHMFKHTLETPYSCHTCGRRCSSPKALEVHEAKHKMGEETFRIFKCTLCSSSFRAKDTLRGHMLTHSSKALHHCPQCDKQFKYIRAMKRHVAVFHSSKTPFKCSVEECGQKFKRNDVYKKHMKIWHPAITVTVGKTKRYPCSVCSARFGVQFHYEDHMKQSHPREMKKLLKCVDCDVSFSTLAHIRRHRKTKKHLELSS